MHDLDETIIARIYRLGRCLRGTNRRAACWHNLTIRQIQALHLIARTRGGLSVSALAAAGQVAPATASQLADRLSVDGWVERSVDRRDRRQIRLRLTKRGRSRFKQAAAAKMGRLHEAIRQLGAADRRELDRLLSRFEELLNKDGATA